MLKSIAILFFLALSLPTHGHDFAGQMHHEEMTGGEGLEGGELINPLRLRALQAAGGLEQGDPGYFLSVIRQFDPAGMATPEQNWLKSKLWAQNHILRVCFFDGSKQAQDHVMALFEEILQHTNLGAGVTLAPCPTRPIDVQIKFETSFCMGYYGRQGRDVMARNPNEPTVSLCGADGPSWSARQNGMIRHELMHTLGAVHEHQHPDSKCREELDWEGLLAYAPDIVADEDLEKWREANYGRITATYSPEDVAVLPPDKTSIMHYRLAGDMFFDPRTATCVLNRHNNELSPGDIAMLNAMYPPRR